MTQANDQGLKRFRELVSAYGARPGFWPEAERRHARAMLKSSAEARRILAEAAQLDRWLDEYQAPAASQDLIERILAGAPAFARGRAVAEAGVRNDGLTGVLRRVRQRLGDGLVRAPVMRPVYAATGAAIMGLALGWGGVFEPSVTAGEEEEILAMALVGDGLEQYDLGEMQ